MGIFSWLFGGGEHNKSRSSAPFLQGSDEYDFEIVGESRYQDNLLKLVGKKQEEGAEKYVHALLIAEPENKYDKNAVRVDIEGYTVGYIPRDEARKIQQDLFGVSRSGTAVCNAVIVGGWKDEESEGHFGVRLDLEIPLEIEEK